MHYYIDIVAHTTAFVTPVVGHWLGKLLTQQYTFLNYGTTRVGCPDRESIPGRLYRRPMSAVLDTMWQWWYWHWEQENIPLQCQLAETEAKLQKKRQTLRSMERHVRRPNQELDEARDENIQLEEELNFPIHDPIHPYPTLNLGFLLLKMFSGI